MQDSVAIGFNSMNGVDAVSVGTVDNVAVGSSTLLVIETGDRNTSVGKDSGRALTTGSDNVFLGDDSGRLTTTNTNLTLLGQNTETSAATGITNAIAIGHDTVVDASNKMRIGDVNMVLVEFAAGTDLQAVSGALGITGGYLLNGSSSGAMTFQPAAAVTDYTLTYPAAQGASSQVLQNDGFGVLSWVANAGSGLSDPMTTRGDIIIRDNVNATNRLAVGAAGEVLQSDGTDIAWAGSVTNAAGTGETCTANCDSCTVTALSYFRMGALVTLSFQVALDATVANVLTSCEFDEPIPSSFTASTDVRINCSYRGGTPAENTNGHGIAETTNDTINIRLPDPQVASAENYNCTGQYDIL